MKIVNFGMYFMVYNFIIGVLVMIASEKLGIYAGPGLKQPWAETSQRIGVKFKLHQY